MTHYLNFLSHCVRQAFLVLLALVLLAAPGLAYAQQELNGFSAPDLNWYTIYGGGYQDYASTMTSDSSGNIYVVGSTYYEWENTGMEPLHPYTPRQYGFVNNMVIAKFNPSGQLLWHTYYGSSSAYTNGRSILIDTSGNLYIIGDSNGEWDGLTPKQAFHGPSDTPDGRINDDVFILKLNSAGAYQWHTFYGSNKIDSGLKAVRESSGNILIAGETEGPWTGLTPKRPFSGVTNFFALSVDPKGDYRWHTFYGMQTGWMNIEDMQLDTAGDVYLTGTSNVGFTGIQPLRPRDTSGKDDILVMKMSKEGVLQWHTFFGGPEGDSGRAIVLNGGNLYLTGSSGKPWPGLNPLNPFNNDATFNLFVLKLNSAGAYQWHTFYGPAGGSDLAIDNLGRIIVAGNGSDLPGLGPVTPNVFGSDTLLMILDAQGKYVSHAYYGSGSEGSNVYEGASEVLLVGSKLYMLGKTGRSWPAFSPPLHYGYGLTDIFLASINITEKPSYATAITLVLPPNPVEVDHDVILTANVVSAGGVVNYGSVTFKDGGVVLGTAYVSKGQAKMYVRPSVAGRHDITAEYSGVAAFLPSQTTTPAVQHVVKIATRLTMTPAQPISLAPGWQYRFDVTVKTVNPYYLYPNGSIVLKAGSMELDRKMLSGEHTYLWAKNLPEGQHEVYAVLEENDVFANSKSNATTVTVEKVKTNLSLVILPLDKEPAAEIRYGTLLQLNTNFGLNGVSPDGAVTIKNGDQTLTTQDIVYGGVTFFATHTLLPGTYTFQAFYPGSTRYTASESALRTIEIRKGVPRITLFAEGGNPAAGGEERRINISVTNPGLDLIQPTGTVTLYEGETEIATLTLVDGVAVSEPITLSEGAHYFTVTYSGDTLYDVKTSVPSPVIVAGTPIYLPVMVR